MLSTSLKPRLIATDSRIVFAPDCGPCRFKSLRGAA